jgi:hypothetical protein
MEELVGDEAMSAKGTRNIRTDRMLIILMGVDGGCYGDAMAKPIDCFLRVAGASLPGYPPGKAWQGLALGERRISEDGRRKAERTNAMG